MSPTCKPYGRGLSNPLVLVITATWIVLSASLVLVNKHILTVNHFTYVYTLSLTHMASAALLSDILLLSVPKLRSSYVKKWTIHASMHAQFFMIGFMFALSLVCSTQALKLMDVPSIQMLKTINPAAIYIMGLLIGVETYSAGLAGSILVVCAGVAMTVYGSVNFTPQGVALQLTSVFIDSARWAWLQKIMQSESLNLNSLNTLSLITPNAAIVLWVLASYFEFGDLVADSNALRHADWVLGSTILAFMLNACSFAFIRATSALTMSVTGVIKDILLISVAWHLFDTQVSTIQATGYMVAVVGMSMHNVLKARLAVSL